MHGVLDLYIAHSREEIDDDGWPTLVVFPPWRRWWRDATELVEGRGDAGGGRGGAGRRTRRRWELKWRDGGEDDERRGAGDEDEGCIGALEAYKGRPRLI